MLNAAARKEAGLPRNEELPISRALCAKILERVKATLRPLRVARGEMTREQLKEEADLSTVRRARVRCFSALSTAENQWAADSFLQGAIRSSRKKRSGRNFQREMSPGSSGRREEVGKDAEGIEEDAEGMEEDAVGVGQRREEQVKRAQ